MKTGGRWCCICLRVRVRVAGFLAKHVSSRGQALKTRWNLTTFKSIFVLLTKSARYVRHFTALNVHITRDRPIYRFTDIFPDI